MELHLVHIKKNYLKNVAAALSNPDGLAVVGIMFVVGKNGSDFEALQVSEKKYTYPNHSNFSQLFIFQP